MKKKKKDFGKNDWSLHQHCVPAYIIITSVKLSFRTETKAQLHPAPYSLNGYKTAQPFTSQA